MLLKDRQELLLEAIGRGFIVLLMSAQIGVDGLCQVVGERGGWLSEEGNDRLGQILQRPAQVEMMVSGWRRRGEMSQESKEEMERTIMRPGCRTSDPTATRHRHGRLAMEEF